jgi:ribose transport system substrate-binding protein
LIQTPVRIAVVAIGLLALAGCTASPAPSESGAAIRIAAVLPNTSDPFFQTVSCGVEAKAAELGVELQTFNATTADTNTIASNFQTASLTSPDGMIVTPFNNNQFVAQYTQLMADGVPVVTGAGSDPQVDYKAISSDTDTAGFAEQVADLIPQGSGTMVYMGGAAGIAVLENRTLPFVNAVQEMRPDLTPLPPDYSGFDINKATTDASAIILANPDLKLIIAGTGPDGQGAAAAIQQAGKKGQITLIAFDAVPPEVDALRAGVITALIAQDPYNIGTSSVQAIVDYLTAHPDGGPVQPAGQEAIPNQLLTADNIDDPKNVNYLYRAEC